MQAGRPWCEPAQQPESAGICSGTESDLNNSHQVPGILSYPAWQIATFAFIDQGIVLSCFII